MYHLLIYKYLLIYNTSIKNLNTQRKFYIKLEITKHLYKYSYQIPGSRTRVTISFALNLCPIKHTKLYMYTSDAKIIIVPPFSITCITDTISRDSLT